ncbi:uncharacterized protein TRIADDRAFT_51027 [Trichoplax adhaerens]|uniref:Uncharacterized protein n=1 Tax=Trichoplax adhaerens TaxID=10228 RepID=B3SAI8_TRIAD|nr:hypothetical protein TRIADDRAFT_51027 [Trichoplax adhaerens]EDV20269.1 hypothetical protein TRIADDRAFT_51027 [Trichoplax adhaerens]|eukprot:XP_002117219.1 hypothetical protein TRIADDRAFT_51027 [Trichoplax adhaerens]
MPLATRGLIAPQNMFLEDLIARSKNLENCFVLANAKQEDNPIVYCSDGYCCLTGYQRHEVLHKAADYEHLYGEETDRKSVSKLKSAFALKQKIQHELTLYKKDGTPFIAAIQIAPVKNEDQEVIMFLITLRDISALRENQNRKSRRFSLLSTTNNYHHSHSMCLTNMDTELPDYKEETPRSPTGIILHYSTTKVIWDWVILFFTFYTAIFVPFELAFNRDYRKEIGFLIMDCIVDVIFLSDVVINFRTTYVDGTGHIVSHPPLIVRNYITGWFVIDLLAALPYEIFTLGDVLRLLRLSRFIRKFNEYVEYGATMIVLLMFTYVLVAHWLACIWYRIGFDECTTFGWLHSLAEQSGITAKVNYTSCQQISVASAYSTSLYFTMSSLTTVGFGNVSANTIGEKIFSIIIMIIGSLMSAFIFGNVTAILQELYSSTQRYHAILKDMKRFNQVYSLPKDLRRRVEDYFISSWAATKGIDTKEILKYWPKEIQAEIKMHMNRKILRDATCFSNASEGCLRQMAERFEMQHTGPGDILIHSGQSLNHLYFIACGSFEVYSADVGVTCILTKGDVFGDDFIKNKGLGRSHSMVRALTYCDLHTISRIHLLEVAGLYPEWAPVFSENLNLTCSLRDSGVR